MRRERAVCHHHRGTQNEQRRNTEKTWELTIVERQPGGKQHAGERGVDHFHPEEVTNVPVSENWVIKRSIQ